MEKKNGVKSLPKGFRFTKAIRELIGPRLLCIKFSDEVEAMVAEDHILAEHIYNYIFPDEAKRHYWAMVEECRALKEDYHHDRITDFNLRMENDGYDNIKYISIGSKSSTPTELDNAFITRWDPRAGMYNAEVDPKGWVPANEEEHYKQEFVYPFDWGTMHFELDLLPSDLQKRILDFDERRTELKQRRREFRYTLEPTLLQIKSAKQFKEFLPNAFDALVDLVLEIKPECSDLPVADGAKQINDLLS